MLRFDAEVLGLDVDVNILDFTHAADLFGLVEDPAAEVVVGRAAASAALAVVFVVVANDERALQIVRELLGTSLDRLLRHVDGPLVVLDLVGSFDDLGLGRDSAGELVIAVGVGGDVAVLDVAIVRVALARTSAATSVGVAILLGFPLLARSPGGLVLLRLLSLLRLVLQDEGAELETEVDVGPLTTGLAVEHDAAILQDDVGLGVLALLAENESGDEAIQMFLELGGLVGTVDDPAIVGRIGVRLSAQFESKVLDDVCRWPSELSSSMVRRKVGTHMKEDD